MTVLSTYSCPLLDEYVALNTLQRSLLTTAMGLKVLLRRMRLLRSHPVKRGTARTEGIPVVSRRNAFERLD